MNSEPRRDLPPNTAPPTAGEAKRVVRSYRLNDELAHRLDVLATIQRRKLYEALEEAIAMYLDKYGNAADGS